MRTRALLCGVVAAIVASFVAAPSTASAGEAHATPVAAVPFARTPQVLDNPATSVAERVLSFAEVGNRIVTGGIFTRVRDVGANGGLTFNRGNVFAFDRTTGAVDRAFAPSFNGNVNVVLAGPNDTVYVGGTFTIVNGVSARNLVQLSLATGQPTAFRAPALNGAVMDLVLAGDRLLVAGRFTTADNVAHGGLASVNATTGALDPYMGIDVAGNHSWPRGKAKAAVGPVKMAISPDGSRLAVIGNFVTADGLPRDQAMVVLLQPTAAVVDPNWRTRRYEAICSPNSFDSYMRDVDYAPDGSYFAIATTGAYGAGTLCDTVARWDTASTGQAVEPRWADYTGGDTLFSVEVTGSAIYTGGHQRWMNNPSAADRAGAGAVPRPGLAAVDPDTGIPLSWNPGRHPRGVGAEALLATSSGLYVGMDTEYVGNYQHFRPRLAYFPLAGGVAAPSEETGTLPANVFLAGRQRAVGTVGVDAVVSRYFTGTTASGNEAVPTGGLQWSRSRGAFRAGNTLFYAYPNSAGAYYLYRRTFDGKTYGPATVVDPYNDPAWSTVASGSKTSTGAPIYYRGMLPGFYGQLSSLTGMFFQDGRIYYTRSGSTRLYWRWFSVDSGIVGYDEYSAATIGFGDVNGMFVSDDTLYWASAANGELRKIAFANGVPSGVSSVASPGPAAGGQDWRTRAMFLGPGGPNQAPAAAFTDSCAGLTCSFDGTTSTDPDGTVVSYAWDFGDGTTATGRQVQHTFASEGSREVALTVTDDRGATARTVRTVSVTAPPPGAEIGLRGAAGTSARAVTSVGVAVPSEVQVGDALVLVLSTNSDATGTAPLGWTVETRQSSGTSITTQVWSRVAQAGDAGSTVTVPLSKQAKVTLQVAAYSGTSVTDPVASVAGRPSPAGTAHTTPTATAASGSWVVSVWSDKQSAARTWAPPASGLAARSNLSGVGTGDIATLLGDSGTGVPGGTVGGYTATVPTASAQATALTLVLAPAG